MDLLRQRRFRLLGGVFLAALFFATQSFNCCNLNGKLLAGLFSAFTPARAEGHACCAKPAPTERRDATSNKECCIQEAQRKVPQAGTQPLEVPDLSGAVVAVFAAPAAAPVFAPMAHRLPADSGPPVYLVQKRLLI